MKVGVKWPDVRYSKRCASMTFEPMIRTFCLQNGVHIKAFLSALNDNNANFSLHGSRVVRGDQRQAADKIQKWNNPLEGGSLRDTEHSSRRNDVNIYFVILY